MVFDIGFDLALVRTLNGIQFGFTLFLIASGLTVILGVLDVLNLSHGEFYALGAYFGIAVYGFVIGNVIEPTFGSAAGELGPGALVVLVLAVVLSAAIGALLLVPIGVVIEAVFLRPIYERDEVYQLLLTFAFLLILQDSRNLFWDEPTTQAPSLINQAINEIPTTELIGIQYSSYRIFAIGISAIVAILLFWYFERTKSGRIVRATAIDREMATALGVSVDRRFTLVFALGAFLAGLAGAIGVPPTSANQTMGMDPLILSFVVIVIGGLGSLRGAFVGALGVGVLSRWMAAEFPKWELAAPFLIMIVVLLIKPEGLFGTRGETA